MTLRFHIAMKAGALKNGWELGSSVYHAVPVGYDRPLCGSRVAINWRQEPGEEVTCPRCLKKLSKMKPVIITGGVPETIGF
ncbi:hypothetical protein AMJ98_PA00106 (plasmid) [Rhizobium sp. N1341]|nr:hypothetical protein AMJ98_PA00106 [Rhizobium sp. N1341]ANM42897.1 hypothetical protein AMK03_PA00106 [Rhizobium sp. N741]